MTFFYDLNQRLASIVQPQQLTESAQLDEKYMGFSKLEKDIARGGDVRDPGAVAASIGRKKYGKEKFQKAAAAGRKLGEAPNEGNEFSGELAKAKASGAKEFKVDGKTYPVKESQVDEGYVDFMDKKAQYSKIGAEVEGRSDDYVVTFKDGSRRRYQELDGRRRVTTLEPVDAPEEQDAEGNVVKRGRGRPKGSKRSLGAKGPSGRSKLMRMEEDYDKDEYDEEGEMAMSQARVIADAAEELQSILDADENLPEWVQKKISLAKEYIDSARDYLKANRPGDEAMAEASTGDYSAKKARAGKDIGKPGKQFAKIAKSAGERYGSKERGEKVAGAVLAKLRAKEDVNEADVEESALQAYLGKKKYGDAGMKALQKAGRDGASKEKMARIRAQHDKLDEVDLEEKAVSKAQRAAAGIARAAQKGEIPRSELRGASKEMARMPAKELRKFAKTKEKGLPEKVGEGGIDPNRHPQTRDYGRGDDLPFDADDDASDRDEFGNVIKHRARHLARKGMRKAMDDKKDDKKTKDDAKVDETTTSGSVAPSAAEPVKKTKGGMQFGKGIYDSMNRELEDMIAESMSINMSDSTEGGRSLTVTASDEDAMKLAAILKMAGMGSMRSEPEAEGGCGAMEEAYGDVDATENQPDYPTNTETSDDALQYAGGLNKPKTMPNPNADQVFNPYAAKDMGMKTLNLEGDSNDELRRIREMAGIGEARKPDFPDIDNDGDRKEPIAKAAQDAEEEKVDEAVEQSLWNLYKRIA